MGLIYENIELVGLNKTKSLLALFDSGASKNHMRKSLFDGDTVYDVGFHIFEGRHDSILADGSIAPGERVRFRALRIESVSIQEPAFVIMENLNCDAIIGAELMQQLGIKLDLPNEKVILPRLKDRNSSKTI